MPDTPAVRSLGFLLPGHARLFHFTISEEDAERLDRVLQQSQTDEGIRFFSFSSPSGVVAAIALRDLQLASIMWDPADGVVALDAEEKDRISIYCRGRAEPFRAGADEPMEISDLFFFLELYEGSADPFLRFIDEDREPVFFRPDQIVLLTAPQWIVDEGREEAEEEDRRVAAQLKAKRGSKTAKKASTSSKPKRRGSSIEQITRFALASRTPHTEK